MDWKPGRWDCVRYGRTGLVLQRFDALYPDGYGLIEHLTLEQIPQAVANMRRIAAESGVVIHG